MNLTIETTGIWISKNKLISILLIGLIQGLLYVFSIPPWWHYDEPGHFEFTWQIANFDHWPRLGEYDEAIRRRIVKSMIKNNYYRNADQLPKLASGEPVMIGTAASKYPLYYILASLPLRLLHNADVVVQNRAARLVSLVLFLVTLFVAWKTLGDLLPKDHPLQWMVTLFIALLPGFADTMTSINDDVGAVMAFSIFVWSGIRLVKHGPSFWNLVLFLLSLPLCYWAKETAWPALPLALPVILLSLFKNRWQWLPWFFIAAVLLVVPFFVFRWGNAVSWYSGYPAVTRVESPLAPAGSHVFLLTKGQSYLQQQVNLRQLRPLQKKNISLGVWMWANRPARAATPVLVTVPFRQIEVRSPASEVALTTEPTFFRAAFAVPDNIDRAWLEVRFLEQADDSVQPEVDLAMYYDGIVIAEGERTDSPPEFADIFASLGQWNGQPFSNLVRNASAEQAAFYLNPAISRKLSGKIPISIDIFLTSFQDWTGSESYNRKILSNMFQNFWGRPARNKVGLLGDSLSYGFLAIVTMLSLPGVLSLFWRKWHVLPWNIMFILGSAVAAVWGLTLVRGEGGGLPSGSPLAFPWTRYAFPAIIPTSLLLCAGWREALRLLGGVFRIPGNLQYLAFVAFMLGLDALALISIAQYFYWNQGQASLLLFVLLISFFFLLLISFERKKGAA